MRISVLRAFVQFLKNEKKWRYVRGILILPACLLEFPQLPAAASPSPTVETPHCVTADCHPGVLSGKVLHGPAAQRKCDGCHQLADSSKHHFTLTRPLDQLCSACHVQTQRTHVHKPVAEGNCTGCHDPHGSDHRFLLIEDAAAGLCFRCHSREDFTGKAHVHGPVEAGACILCHEAHSSWQPKLLTKDKDSLCLNCHEDVVADLRRYRYVHEPVAEGRCSSCHDPHASDHAAQLRESPATLCFSCHEHTNVRQLIESSDHVHGAVTSGDACAACHTGHGGATPKLLVGPLLGTCLSCHDRPLTTPEGHRLADMAALLKNNANHHGPVRRADCVACHNPHASRNFRLLAREYPNLFYAPFDLQNYDLCFTCHVKELVTLERGEGVTGFRQGDVNLHYVHVHKDEKGRTCRACHEVHASKRPFHIRDKVPFGKGGWEMEIHFEASSEGGRCGPGCHQERSYSRNPASTRPSSGEPNQEHSP